METCECGTVHDNSAIKYFNLWEKCPTCALANKLGYEINVEDDYDRYGSNKKLKWIEIEKDNYYGQL